MSVSEPFVRRPVATTLLAIALALAGTLAYELLPVTPLPQVDFPTIVVSAALPGAGPETMASSVAMPLERQFGRISGITEMTSSSSIGSTSVVLQFALDRDIDGAARDVQAAINAARAQLPANLPSNPGYRKVNPTEAPAMILALTSETQPIAQVFDVASSVLGQTLSQVKGVGQVTVGGGALPAVRVEANPVALSHYGIGLDQVRTAIASANAYRPTGRVADGDRAWTIDTAGQLTKADEYRPLLVAWRNGAPVRLGDVAAVEDSLQDLSTLGLVNGRRAVMLIVTREPGANIIDTVERVRALLPQLQALVPASMSLAVAVDRTPTIRSSIADVERTLVIAIVLVVLVVFLFLRRPRATLIPAVAVPLSLAGTFAAMYLLDYSLDNLSLMALTISTGFVIDDAIVVIENVTRHLEAGRPPLEAALIGAREVGFTVLSMSLSLVAVFLPILLMGGIVGRLFREFAVTLSVAIAVSMVVSLTVTPMLCARVLRPPASERHGRPFLAGERLFDGLRDRYAAALRVVLRHPALTLAATAATIALNGYLYAVVPKGFFPQEDTGMLTGTVQARQDISFPAMHEKLTELTRIVSADPGVAAVVGFTGGGSGTANTARLFISLRPLEQRQASAAAIAARLSRRAAVIPGAQLFVQAAQDIRVGGRSGNAQYQYTLQGADLDALRVSSQRLVERLRTVPAVTDVTTDVQSRGLEARLDLDRDTLARLGLSVAAVDAGLYAAFGQSLVSTIYSSLNQYRVVLEAAPRWWADPAALASVQLTTGAGATLPLTALSRSRTTETTLVVNHQSQFPSVTVSFNLAPGAALGDAVTAVNGAAADIGLPKSIQGSFQGTAQAFQASLANQVWLVLAALATVYIVLGMLYESFVHPITILSTLPSAGVGALVALLVTHLELSVIAIIGIILLIGIVKKNAIMMIDFAVDAERREGKDPRAAIYEACLLRFRPILMTTMAALFGALPVAFASGIGAELRRPLGVAIIGGLIVSQALTLFTTPVIYLMLDRLRLRRLPSPRPATAVGALLILGAACSSGCAVGPRYAVPPVVTPPAYKEAAPGGAAGTAAGGGAAWQPANPRDDQSKGAWWRVYHDAQLDALLARIDVSNQQVKAAEAQFAQARAMVRASRAGFAPTATVAPSVSRARGSATRSTAAQTGGRTSNDDQLPFDLSYEADVWGKVRNSVAASRAAYQASAADLETMRLSMGAELAADYFEARAIDAQARLLDQTIAGLARGLALTEARHQAGFVSGLDVAQAQTQLETARAQRIDLGVQRATLEHAIAVLIGEAPATFTLAAAGPETASAAAPGASPRADDASAVWASAPEIAVGLPSTLLERRPDVAAAERRVRAANANIGVAKAAYFPAVTLAGSGGFASQALATWLSWPSALWSLGATVSQTVFDGGARRAEVARSQAAYDAAVSSYRQTVLAAFQDVEDNAAALRILADEARQQDVAVHAAERSVDLALAQYRSGVTSYLDVITAQNALLDNRRTALAIRGQRLVASVQLIKALGGGWDRARLPE
jgi:hydrophobe/amphiphile efflux-1 (HAE1) family protein/NodT family efflux transporter outer membrane factor (OMF) lipoprotein